MNTRHLTVIKWACTSLMFVGAIMTSTKIHPWLNFLFLTAGNVAWATILLSMREWAAAAVFVIMGSSWAIGLIYYLLS